MTCTATPTSRLLEPIPGLPPDDVIFGKSALMGKIRQKLEKAAGANIAVLLRGQSGTGKEVFAKLIHSQSPWRDGSFVKVSCPAIPGTLIESELFGYEKGAFTGAYGAKPGRIELAHRGTLFLDEIGELEPSIQAKLLQLLQDGEFNRIGAAGDRRIEVRFVCATNRSLEREMKCGNFREDLFYRISVLTIQLPPLRDRRDDIPVLVDYFLRIHSMRLGHSVRPLSEPLVADLKKYSWPGNIRELENLIKSYIVFGSEEDIRAAMRNGQEDFLCPEISPNGTVSLKQAVRAATKHIERTFILKALETHQWNRRKAAEALDISYAGLLCKMREAGMPPTRGPRASLASVSGSEQGLSVG
jgi:two-component system, NtrC family, response regulator AtoC